MLSWLTGSRAGHDGHDPGRCFSAHQQRSMLTFTADTMFMEPETPAHLFAVKAFKQAFFGTPPPITPFVPKVNGLKFQSEANTMADSAKEKPLPAIKRLSALRSESVTDSVPNASPTKRQGILMTPGTAPGRRKQVKFGEKVVDNEGKRKKYSLSGLPDDYPGKFPSPWTPKITAYDQLKGTELDKRLESRLREVVDDKKTSSATTSIPHLTTAPITRAKDNNDITTDLSTPISAAGRYWKSQYDMYSTRSEAELTRLIAKHRLVKDYARMKDEEVTSLKTRLEMDRRKRHDREKSLEGQVKDLRERLRLSMAENAKMTAELSVLRISTAEGKDLLTVTSENVNGILKELVDAGFQDIEIPAAKRESRLRMLSDHVKPVVETSGQDIWLDNDLEDETFGSAPRRRLVKSTPARKSLLGQSAPLSSKSIREKLANPLASRNANIMSKLPSPPIDKQLFGQQSNLDMNRFSADINRTPTPTPRSGGKASNTSISGHRKEGALARIEERRRNRQLVKPTLKK
jgi:hypothetical protein